MASPSRSALIEKGAESAKGRGQRSRALQELLKERAEKRRMQAVTGNGTAEPLRFDAAVRNSSGKKTPSEENGLRK